jgi:hypothetical protein
LAKLSIRPLSTVDDYADTGLPSAAYAPAMRAAYARIHAQTFLEDLSFGVSDGTRDLACCLLALSREPDEESGFETRLWSLGLPAVFWTEPGLTPGLRTACFEAARTAFKNRLTAHNRARLSLADYFGNESLNELTLHALQHCDCRAELSFSHVIDLRPAEETLRSSLRRRYKALINKANRLYSFDVVDRRNYSEAFRETMHDCHILASGRDVYPESFWRAIGGLVRDGAAFMVIAIGSDRRAVGCTVCVGGGDKMYYGIGAYDRSLDKDGLSKACLWAAVKQARADGFSLFEVGRTDFPALSPAISDKEMNIGFFKRGFGGVNKPVLYLRSALS